MPIDKEELIDALLDVFGQDGSDRGFADLMWDTFSGPDNWERRTATAALQGLLMHHGSAADPERVADKAMDYCAALEKRLEKTRQKRLDEENARRNREARASYALKNTKAG